MSDPTQGAAGLDIAALVQTWTPPPADGVPPPLDLVGHLHPIHDPAEECPTVTTETTTRPSKRACELIVGDSLWSRTNAVRPVRHVEPYTNEHDKQRVLVVVDLGHSQHYDATELVGIATPEEIAEAEAAGHRAAVVAQIRALAELVETHTDIPAPRSVHAEVCVYPSGGHNPRAVVEATAAALNAGVGFVSADVMQTKRAVPGPAEVQYTAVGYLGKPTEVSA